MAKQAKRLIVVRFRQDRTLYEVDYRDQLGRRRRPLFATEALALEAAARIRKELEETSVALLDDPDTTLRNYTTRWLETAAHDIESKTLSSYRQLLEMHVLPTLGHLRLRELHRCDA